MINRLVYKSNRKNELKISGYILVFMVRCGLGGGGFLINQMVYRIESVPTELIDIY
jgi:hypothetical protein